MPSPVIALTLTNIVSPPHSSGTRPSSPSSRLTRSGSAPGLSILLTATMIGTFAAFAWAMASLVCGMTPSSAATTRTTMSVTLAPRARICVNASWPGVSRKTTVPCVRLDLVGADVLRDAAGLAAGDVRLADLVEQARLAVVDVAHDGDDRRAAFPPTSTCAGASSSPRASAIVCSSLLPTSSTSQPNSPARIFAVSASSVVLMWTLLIPIDRSFIRSSVALRLILLSHRLERDVALDADDLLVRAHLLRGDHRRLARLHRPAHPAPARAARAPSHHRATRLLAGRAHVAPRRWARPWCPRAGRTERGAACSAAVADAVRAALLAPASARRDDPSSTRRPSWAPAGRARTAPSAPRARGPEAEAAEEPPRPAAEAARTAEAAAAQRRPEAAAATAPRPRRQRAPRRRRRRRCTLDCGRGRDARASGSDGSGGVTLAARAEARARARAARALLRSSGTGSRRALRGLGHRVTVLVLRVLRGDVARARAPARARAARRRRGGSDERRGHVRQRSSRRRPWRSRGA